MTEPAPWSLHNNIGCRYLTVGGHLYVALPYGVIIMTLTHCDETSRVVLWRHRHICRIFLCRPILYNYIFQCQNFHSWYLSSKFPCNTSKFGRLHAIDSSLFLSAFILNWIDNHWIHFACTFDSKAIAYSTQYANEHCIYSRHSF